MGASIDLAEIRNAQLAQLVSRLAAQFGCTFEIDWQQHTICFEGPEDVKTKLAMELDKYVDNF